LSILQIIQFGNFLENKSFCWTMSSQSFGSKLTIGGKENRYNNNQSSNSFIQTFPNQHTHHEKLEVSLLLRKTTMKNNLSPRTSKVSHFKSNFFRFEQILFDFKFLELNFKRTTCLETSVQVQHISGEMEKVQAPYESTLCMVTGPNFKILLVVYQS
jgi:hypothetical protein